MERPAHLMIRRRPFSPHRIVAISGALMVVAAAYYGFVAGLRISGIVFYPHIVEVDFFKTVPPPPKPIVLPRLELVQPPPPPPVPPPEIQIQIPKPPPHIRVAKMRPHPVVRPQSVRIAGPAPPPPPVAPKPRGITAPVSIGAPHTCDSKYPPMAVRLSQQGTTLVRFTVNTDGSVSNVQVARSSGHQILDDAAIGCASAWRYKPALDDGRPVAQTWSTNVQWKLQNHMRAI